MNEQGTQIAPLLFNQLNPGGGEVITHYDFFMEANWLKEHRPDGGMDKLHFLFEAEGGLRNPSGDIMGPRYIVRIFDTRNGFLMGSSEKPSSLSSRRFFNDYLWDKPDIKGLRASFMIDGLSNMWSDLWCQSFFLIWARFTVVLRTPIIHKIIDIGASNRSDDNAFSKPGGMYPDKGAIIRPDVLTFLTYDEFMKKLKAAWNNKL